MIIKPTERRNFLDTGVSYNHTDVRGWYDRAACAGMSSDIFYPNRYDEDDSQFALTVCGACPVRQQCLDEAIEIEEDAVTRRYGIFGGMTPAERYAEWKRRGGVHTGAYARPVNHAAYAAA